jgi:predicted transglutaminase-like cysteine proteinase
MRRWSVLFTAVFLLVVSTTALAADVDRTFTWTYAGRSWTTVVSVSVDRYRFFRTQPRLLGHANYTGYITDTRDDADLQRLISQVGQLAADANLDAWERLNFVIAFVQSIPYVPEAGEYPRYPLETLYEQQGDCEDLSILTAALLQQMGFDVILLAFIEEEHMAVGVSVTPPGDGPHRSYVWNQKTYYYLETTYPGWTIGQSPEGFDSQPSIVALHGATLASPQRP